ncbi:2'-5' RNA ligase family protein [Microbacterium sp. QXD-8]|uniref:2'-5' RNA ligase family protein n=1 Tax=Microbacterium psychrotolerans TaxID=3068321 RepID=A0ABU0Z2B8_9MICO|nr:2'-5' RNA ligase family protein [Microbacterium sp. QXD-8]MDQ7877681.1 2'-5' RNA ligase family protein [Microbacterium sp. QXD-8]
MEHHRLVTIMATPGEVAATVDRRRRPVHVTLVGNFHVDPKAHDVLSTDLATVTSSVQAFQVRLGPAAQFGGSHNIPVLLAEHPMFHLLHTALAARVKGLTGFAAAEPAYWTGGYRPHVTLGTVVNAVEGELLTVNWITLVALEGRTGRRLSTVQLTPR